MTRRTAANQTRGRGFFAPIDPPTRKPLTRKAPRPPPFPPPFWGRGAFRGIARLAGRAVLAKSPPAPQPSRPNEPGKNGTGETTTTCAGNPMKRPGKNETLAALGLSCVGAVQTRLVAPPRSGAMEKWKPQRANDLRCGPGILNRPNDAAKVIPRGAGSDTQPLLQQRLAGVPFLDHVRLARGIRTGCAEGHRLALGRLQVALFCLAGA